MTSVKPSDSASPQHDGPHTLIYDVKRCKIAFRQLLRAIRDAADAGVDGEPCPDWDFEAWESQALRFQSWENMMTRIQQDRLEFQLADASHVRHQVFRLLDDLKLALTDARSILSGNSTPWHRELEKDLLENWDALGDMGEDMGELPSTPYQTELDQILGQITDTIDCLNRLSIPIRRPAPLDRLVSPSETLSPLQKMIAPYVWLFPDATEVVRDQLLDKALKRLMHHFLSLKSNPYPIRRRKLGWTVGFEDLDHADYFTKPSIPRAIVVRDIQMTDTSWVPEVDLARILSDLGLFTSEGTLRRFLSPSCPAKDLETLSYIVPLSVKNKDRLGQFLGMKDWEQRRVIQFFDLSNDERGYLAQYRLLSPSDRDASYNSLSASDKDKFMDFRGCSFQQVHPGMLPWARLDCPHCPERYFTGRKYETDEVRTFITNHIMSEHRPYFCFNETCITSHAELSSREEWEEHLLQCNPGIWQCAIHGCGKSSFSRDGYRKHIEQEHPDLSDKLDLDILLTRSQKTWSRQRCPLCPLEYDTYHHFKHHVGEHQVNIALFVLRKMGDYFRNATKGPETKDTTVPPPDLHKWAWAADTSDGLAKSVNKYRKSD